MLLEQGNICKRGSACGKAGGSLDKIGSAVCNHFAHFYLFFFRKQTCFNDYLENIAAAGILQGTDFFFHQIKSAVFDPA